MAKTRAKYGQFDQTDESLVGRDEQFVVKHRVRSQRATDPKATLTALMLQVANLHIVNDYEADEIAVELLFLVMVQDREITIIEEQLRPCPFCGDDSAPTVEEVSQGFKVTCDEAVGGCGASTAWNRLKEDSVRHWNKRDGE